MKVSLGGWLRPRQRYRAVRSVEGAETDEFQTDGGAPSAILVPLLIVAAVSAGLTTGALLVSSPVLAPVDLHEPPTYAPASAPSSCAAPVLRREWRMLDEPERAQYIQAVRCTTTKPSLLQDNGRLYDDLALVHRSIGMLSHEASAFLPWHRYFIHVYEKLLWQCGYRGALPYWDWTLDWRALELSSIWNATTGFGGDGAATHNATVGSGRCVRDGPFADLVPRYFNTSDLPHCLSRRFHDEAADGPGTLPGYACRPEAMGLLLNQPNYASFLSHLEKEVHNVIHRSIGGDFLAVTAPNDPIFFLHHANLDRLWWLWQQGNPRRRLVEYNGQHLSNSTEPATLHDLVSVGGLAADVSVADVIDAGGGILCYEY